MKKYLIAAGVTSLLIAAQAMASDAAGLIGAPETAVAPAKAAGTASAPVAVARAFSNAPAQPLMVAGDAGAPSASTLAVPAGAEVTATGTNGADSRVPDRLAPSYNASLSSSTTQTTSRCDLTTQKTIFGRESNSTNTLDGLTAEECEARRASTEQSWLGSPTFVAATAAFIAATVVVTNDGSKSD